MTASASKMFSRISSPRVNLRRLSLQRYNSTQSTRSTCPWVTALSISSGTSGSNDSARSRTSSTLSQSVILTEESGCIILSPHSIKKGKSIDTKITKLITDEHVKTIVRRCRTLYMNGRKQVLFRTPSKTRNVVCEKVEPYLEAVNKEFAKLNIPLYSSREELVDISFS